LIWTVHLKIVRIFFRFFCYFCCCLKIILITRLDIFFLWRWTQFKFKLRGLFARRKAPDVFFFARNKILGPAFSKELGILQKCMVFLSPHTQKISKHWKFGFKMSDCSSPIFTNVFHFFLLNRDYNHQNVVRKFGLYPILALEYWEDLSLVRELNEENYYFGRIKIVRSSHFFTFKKITN
jgi:hypothetical protein